jgi:4-amino-4-deoxy-L-arabinose transferase-like glycosyltransferase
MADRAGGGSAPEIPDRTWTVWAIAISVLIAFTRVIALGNSPLDLLPDEAQYWSWSRHLAFGYFSKPPFIAWLIAGTTKLGGNAELFVRLGAPLLHAATGIVLCFLGRAMFSARVGFVAAVLYATLPGVSFSGLVISTDAPLLFFWALGLLSAWHLMKTPGWLWAARLGVALGLGVLSKYAMAYFVVGLAVYLAFGWRDRVVGLGRYLGGAAVIGAVILAPNVVWNAVHGWATVGHTAANANWREGGLHLRETAEFAAAQFGVFGPVLFVALLLRLALLRRQPPDDRERFLLAFAIPVLVLMVLQSGLSRAHANWAAVSYVSATVLLAAWFDRLGRAWPVYLALGTQIAAFALFTLAFAGALATPLPKSVDILHQMRGWRSLADMVWRKMGGMPPGTSVAADDREVMAELDFYMRGRPFPLVMATGSGAPGNQYELENAVTADTGAHALLVARYPDRHDILDRFDHHEMVEAWTIGAGQGRFRRYYVYDVTGFKGDQK